MYTRIVETTSKHGKARELCHTIDAKVLPILRKQNGFVDELVMVSDADPNRVTSISFWKTKEDAERYNREQFDNVKKAIEHTLDGALDVRTFDVHTSTAHRITAEKAERAA
ncbi:MAG TPA: antibiotic biosynthesis monooxygenase [Candidatus Sulfotelmatobacter sp.]|nr:antibiotic biosynthesis monooxygenase [Candidatus Sulfotelmatobacter sp.]